MGVVLGAAMWQNPHILVIDEPTNYLDRDALGALTEAIETWSGGVVVISHNLAFCDRVATEKWIMDAGHLRAEGGEYVDVKVEDKNDQDTVVDASGNVLDVRREKKMDPKDIKKSIKDCEKKLKDAKKKGGMSEEEVWALEDKLAALKEQLKACFSLLATNAAVYCMNPIFAFERPQWQPMCTLPMCVSLPDCHCRMSHSKGFSLLLVRAGRLLRGWSFTRTTIFRLSATMCVSA